MHETKQVSMAVLGWKLSNALELQRSVMLLRQILKPVVLIIALKHRSLRAVPPPHVLQIWSAGVPPKTSFPPSTDTVIYVSESGKKTIFQSNEVLQKAESSFLTVN